MLFNLIFSLNFISFLYWRKWDDLDSFIGRIDSSSHDNPNTNGGTCRQKHNEEMRRRAIDSVGISIFPEDRFQVSWYISTTDHSPGKKWATIKTVQHSLKITNMIYIQLNHVYLYQQVFRDSEWALNNFFCCTIIPSTGMGFYW